MGLHDLLSDDEDFDGQERYNNTPQYDPEDPNPAIATDSQLPLPQRTNGNRLDKRERQQEKLIQYTPTPINTLQAKNPRENQQQSQAKTTSTEAYNFIKNNSQLIMDLLKSQNMKRMVSERDMENGEQSDYNGSKETSTERQLPQPTTPFTPDAMSGTDTRMETGTESNTDTDGMMSADNGDSLIQQTVTLNDIQTLAFL